MIENKYQSMGVHNCIDAYKEPDDSESWTSCPKCGLKPKIWVFDNGRFTACGCWESKYDGFRVEAESIMTAHLRDGNTKNYNSNALKENWNNYCERNKA